MDRTFRVSFSLFPWLPGPGCASEGTGRGRGGPTCLYPPAPGRHSCPAGSAGAVNLISLSRSSWELFRITAFTAQRADPAARLQSRQQVAATRRPLVLCKMLLSTFAMLCSRCEGSLARSAVSYVNILLVSFSGRNI